MIQNHLKVAWRTLRRNPVYAAISVSGLAVAIATCLLIGLFVQDELSHDTFHPQADRVLSVVVDNELLKHPQRMSPPGFAPLLKAEIPEVEHVTQTEPTESIRLQPELRGRESVHHELRVLRADSSFFDVFTGFPLQRGRRADALDEPGEAVLTASAAQSMFGDQNPVGRTLRTGGENDRRYTVVGLTRVPDHSTLQFDVVVRDPAPSDPARPWTQFSRQTYARVNTAVRPDTLAATLQSAMPDRADRIAQEVELIPLPDLYLSSAYEASGFKGQPRYLYLFGSVGILILLIAGVNYVNLSVAQVDRRTGEIGIRRTVGARRTQVVGQFLTEALLVALTAFGLGVALAALILPAFNALFGTQLALMAPRHGWVLAGGFGIVLGMSMLAGAYPAYALSRFRPTRTLREASQTTIGGGGWLQKGLVVAQFAASAGLIFGTVVIYQQLDYLQTKDLGFDDERVATTPLGDLSPDRQRVLRRTALDHSAVQQATIGDAVPGAIARTFRLEMKTLSDSVRTQNRDIEVYPIEVDTNYVETLDLSLIAGRRFAEGASNRKAYILNRKAVEVLGWTPETAVGMPFSLYRNEGVVVGVVENFHVESLRRPVAPVVLAPSLDLPGSGGDGLVLAARLASDAVEDGLDHLRRIVEGVAPEQTFEYTFLDDRFDQMYKAEERLGRIFLGFALIAVVLAAMGLFGLASYAVQRRTQELGIRKALGATGANVLGLLSREYGLLMGGALLVGLPLAYLGVQRWLRAFAYRVDVSVGAFVLTVGLVVLIAAASIGYHGLRAVRIDPARTLRSE